MAHISPIISNFNIRKAYKKKYSLFDLYKVYQRVPKAIKLFLKNKRKGQVDAKFLERLQLAVTEVNGCAICSYAHTKIALKMGLDNQEIAAFLGGENQNIKPFEAKAIAFAQHYADSEGIPEIGFFEGIIEEYGKQNAQIILAAIQLMMAGNVYGIPQSAFISRLKGNPYENSSLVYEITLQLFGLLVIPLALAHGWVNDLLGIENQKFILKI